MIVSFPNIGKCRNRNWRPNPCGFVGSPHSRQGIEFRVLSTFTVISRADRLERTLITFTSDKPNSSAVMLSESERVLNMKCAFDEPLLTATEFKQLIIPRKDA